MVGGREGVGFVKLCFLFREYWGVFGGFIYFLGEGYYWNVFLMDWREESGGVWVRLVGV